MILTVLIVLLAVLEKRCGFTLGNKDVYVNVIGGLKVNEPACDLSMAVAIVSNLKKSYCSYRYGYLRRGRFNWKCSKHSAHRAAY